MEHKIINTGDYLLIVDDSEIKDGEWVYVIDENFLARYFYNLNSNYKKVIAYLPLNNSPILEGVDLLPPLEDDVEKLADEIVGDSIYYEEDRVNLSDGMDLFMLGYNKAKEKYKYTEEDLAKIFYVGVQLGINQEIAVTSNKPLQDEDAVLKKCIQSLQQPKMPVGFECEMEVARDYDNYGSGDIFHNNRKLQLVTTTNSQGLTQWVGKYIY